MLYLFKAFYENKVVIIYKIDLGDIPQKQTDKSGYLFKLLNVEDDGVINQIEKMAEWLRGETKAKLSKNGLCMAVLDSNNKVIGFYLASFGKASLESARKFGIKRLYIAQFLKILGYKKLIYKEIQTEGFKLSKSRILACLSEKMAPSSTKVMIDNMDDYFKPAKKSPFLYTIKTSEFL
jgi:hypothetical protein